MSVICDIERPRQSRRVSSNWPRITVVTPSYNQGQFLERAIRSVLSQNYPNLEYFVFDAGSTDGSLAILKKYDKRLTYWTSQADRGQSDAISKGWSMATGDVLAWLNSDDFYYPGALEEVGRIFGADPERKMVCGAVALVDGAERRLRVKQPGAVAPEALLPWVDLPPQAGTFIRRDIFDRLGGPRLDLHYVMDWELWLRVSLNYPTSTVAFSNRVIAADRQWSGTKTLNAAGRDAAEGRKVLQELFGSNRLAPDLRALERVALARSWWRQSKGELRNGLRRSAFLSLSKAVRLAPRSFPALKVLRQFKRILFYSGVNGKSAA
ncbi:MAG TPA: glycosyltransferase family 2 protein [Verrucomicrobiae bacterium]|nr:glycosyltransferase family 2 protein [Verrucomicrobiae bacterium]